MSEQSYHFDAFISYRHNERDKKIVDRIQKLTENFRSPCDGEYIRKGERIQRLFTDRSELPMSADLGASITQAIAQSRFFLVIASPEYLQSRWCMKELSTFLEYNHYSTDRILFVHVGGHPSCITDILSAVGICVGTDTFREPFYINACSLDVKDSIKTINKEYLRLAAVLIGCGYDSLYQRHKRARLRKILISTVVTLIICTLVGAVFAVQSNQRKQEADYRAIDASISASHKLLLSGDRVDALKTMQTLYSRYGENETYAEYIVQKLQSDALSACYVPAFTAFAAEELQFESSGISVSSDGEYVIVYDVAAMRDEGQMRLFLYDEYLHKLSEHTLPVDEWKDELMMAHISARSLRIDYHEADGVFEIEALSDSSKSAEDMLGRILTFSAQGELMSNNEISADEVSGTSVQLRKMYNSMTLESGRPACMGDGCLYTVVTKDESGYEPYGNKNDQYQLVSMTIDGDVEYISTLERTSEIHALDDITITDDNRFVLIKETRGVYNDVLTVCDTQGQWDGARIDMGDHTVSSVQYRFDEEKQEAYFLFNLSVAGETDASLIALCTVASGQLLSCEMYESRYAYACLFSEQGYVYIMNDSEITVVATENMCLPEQMAEIDNNVTFSTDYSHNDLIENVGAFSPDSTFGMKNVRTESVTITPDVSRMHHTTPSVYSGNDTGIGINDSTGNTLVCFYSTDFKHAYFNEKDGVFGLIDYSTAENSEMFTLYDFGSLMEIWR